MAEFQTQHDAEVEHTHHVDREPAAGTGHDHATQVASALGNQRVGRVMRDGVQREGATSAQQLDESVARAIEDRRGQGRPLEEGVQADMEQAMGHDLSNVRVHTDSTAHELNSAVNARAFTSGDDVFFKQGTYDPDSSSGRELLGHELTHVVQQRTGTSGLGAGEVSDPSDPAEVDAAAAGKAIGANPGGAPSATAAAGTTATGGVARDEEDLDDAAGEPAGIARNVSEDEEDELLAEDG